MLLSLAAAAACSAQVDDSVESDEGSLKALQLDATKVRALPIRSDRSVLVTSPKGMAVVDDKVSLGILLHRLAKAAAGWAAANGDKIANPKANQWVDQVFTGAANEYADHAGSPGNARLGLVQAANPYRHVQKLWPQLGNADIGRGPFRLLAVVNRLDVSGDVDDRGIIDAAKDPRTIGEGRLIFGLVDDAMEKNEKRPYPMTFIIEFRLPALDANYMPIPNFDFRTALFDDTTRATQLERWGLLWRSLSQWDPDKQPGPFGDRLWEVVRRFAVPENFVALRSNTELRAGGEREFELREWYMLKNDAWQLIPRKPRDEPYGCADGPDLAKLVDYYWDPVHDDLDMARLSIAKPNTVDGYNIPRTVGEGPKGPNGLIWGDPNQVLRGCPVDGNKPVKFEMPGDPTPSPRVTSPFGRAKDDRVWQLADTFEHRRHQFAIRTCTGCHSKEAGVMGFHVFPRMPGEASRLSQFLEGGARFDHGGKSYAYHELSNRKAWLDRTSKHDPTIKLFESLYRNDDAP